MSKTVTQLAIESKLRTAKLIREVSFGLMAPAVVQGVLSFQFWPAACFFGTMLGTVFCWDHYVKPKKPEAAQEMGEDHVGAATGE